MLRRNGLCLCTLEVYAYLYFNFPFFDFIENFYNGYIFCLCNKSHYSFTQVFKDYDGKFKNHAHVKIKDVCWKNHR